MTEQWRTVAGFAAYEVSNLGRVRRVAGGDRRGTVGPVGGVLKQCPNHKGYMSVYLSVHSKKFSKVVHRLVATAFIPNPKHLPQVNHTKGNKADNRSIRLEWSNQVKNMRHSAKHGLHGEGVHRSQTRGKWMAQYNPKPRQKKHLGTFNTKAEALRARRTAIATM